MHPTPQEHPASAFPTPTQPAQSRYTFVVKANNPVPAARQRDVEMSSTIQVSGARRDLGTVAEVFERRVAERWNRRSPIPFWIHGANGGALMCSVQPAGPDVYDVCAADGAPLARISRRAGRVIPWPRRVRWSVQLSGAPHAVKARVGSGFTWLLYVVTSPLWLLFFLCMLVYSLFEGDTADTSLDGPTRTRWRTPGAGTALDYRGISKVYHYEPRHLDVRVAYAQAVLHAWERVR
ncbi:hypothetical protein ACFY94_10985 [Streptomyces griseorubiginosus]|uniref:hypothetical protein n=1 Tax=Streptomyces griseorubiginosus TaxID=67304 RepID=UPI0036EA77B5